MDEILRRMVGKRAFTPVLLQDGWGLGRADFGTRGYTPLDYGPFKTQAEARRLADRWNEKVGLSRVEAAIIVANTMRSDRGIG